MITKKELINDMENISNLSKKDCESALAAFVDVVKQQIEEQEKKDETR